MGRKKGQSEMEFISRGGINECLAQIALFHLKGMNNPCEEIIFAYFFAY
jgi:hypothetical protein